MVQYETVGGGSDGRELFGESRIDPTVPEAEASSRGRIGRLGASVVGFFDSVGKVIGTISALVALLVALGFVTLGRDNNSEEAAASGGGQSGGVEFRIEPDLEAYDVGWSAAFDGPLPATDDAPIAEQFQYIPLLEWAKARSAIDVDASYLRLLLENRGTERVTIRAVRAKVLERLGPISQTLLVAPSAGVNELVELQFDLDSGDDVTAMTTGGEPFFSTRNVTLDTGETTDLRMTVETQRCFCRYVFELEIVTVDSTLTLEVRNSSGRPFSISGTADEYEERWSDGGLACNLAGIFASDARGLVDCEARA